jgi:hypothetical protein
MAKPAISSLVVVHRHKAAGAETDNGGEKFLAQYVSRGQARCNEHIRAFN